MKDNQSDQVEKKATSELSQHPRNINENNRCKHSPKGTTHGRRAEGNRKWSLKRHWKQATWIKRAEWVGGVVLGLAALIYYGTQIFQAIWGTIESEKHYASEHRPKVIFSRAPVLIGAVNCQVTKTAIYFHTGEMQIWVKNIGNADATAAFIGFTEPGLVPEKRVGNSTIDQIPPISDNTCAVSANPKTRMFPLYAGQETAITARQIIGARSLVKTKSLTFTLGGPQTPPTPSPDSSPTYVPSDAVFQLYAPICVYYLDSHGKRYATCQEYSLAVTGRANSSDESGFSCTESPVKGTFFQAFSNFCSN